MSRKRVLVAVFLAVLPVVSVAENARGDDPPKKGAASAENPFGDADDAATSRAQRIHGALPDSKAADAADPFGDADFTKANESKPRKPEAVIAKPDESKPHKPAEDATKPVPFSGPKLHGGKKAILKALKQTATLQFAKTPLKDVLDCLSKTHRIPILMDASALKEAGVDESAPVTCNLSGIPLQSALEIILDELKLTWAIHHDVLMITSPEKAESDEYLYTKCYDVTDLIVTPRSHYDIEGPLAYQVNRPIGLAIGASTGFGNTAPACGYINSPVLYEFNPIKDAITNLVATKSWVDNGGTGTIAEHDCFLAISQSREVHAQIEQFLADLRARRRAVSTLSVELHWLWLNAKQRDQLLAGREKPSSGQPALEVDPQRLRQIAREVPGFHAQVACLNGLATAIAAGDLRPIIVNAVPVIDGAVGYSPTVCVPNVGVTAQVWPTLVPGTKTATLDVASIITRWGPPQPPAIIGAAWPAHKQVIANKAPPASNPAQNVGAYPLRGVNVIGLMAPPPAPGTAKPAPAPPPAAPTVTARSIPAGSASCPIDQPIMPTQQMGTTLRVPLGKPVIVGSMTFAPAGAAGLGAAKEDPVEVYLIATTSIVK